MRPLPESDLEEVLEQTRPLWEELRGARLFVTGGTGFFGIWLVESFLHARRRIGHGASMTVLSRDPERFLASHPHLRGAEGLCLVRGDVRDFDFPEGAFSHVIHAATEADPRVMLFDPLDYYDSIVIGIRRVLDFAKSRRCRRFLLTSTGAVYGKQPPDIELLTEDFCGGPNPISRSSAYAEAKRASELLVILFSEKESFDAVIARGFAFAGPGLPIDKHFAFGNFVRDAIRGGPVNVLGDGSPYRSYLYASDMTVWLWTMLVRGERSRAYNLGAERAVRISELAEKVAGLAGLTQSVHISVPLGSSPCGGRYVPSTKLARETLGLEERVSLELGISRTLAWNRACF